MSAPPVRSTGVARSVVVVFPPTFMMTVVPLAIVRFALPPRVMLLMFIETVEFVPPTMFRVPPFIVRLPIDRVAPFAVIVTTPEPKTEVHVAGKVTEMPAAREHEPVKLPVDDPMVAAVSGGHGDGLAGAGYATACGSWMVPAETVAGPVEVSASTAPVGSTGARAHTRSRRRERSVHVDGPGHRQVSVRADVSARIRRHGRPRHQGRRIVAVRAGIPAHVDGAAAGARGEHGVRLGIDQVALEHRRHFDSRRHRARDGSIGRDLPRLDDFRRCAAVFRDLPHRHELRGCPVRHGP